MRRHLSLFATGFALLGINDGWQTPHSLAAQPFTPQQVVTMTAPTPQQLADLTTVRQRFLRSQLASNPKEQQTLTTEAAKYRDTLGVDGKWSNLTYADLGHGLWGPNTHLGNVLVMAKAYNSDGQLKGDAALKVSIERALDAFLVGDYRHRNWWHNQIGVPIQIGTILLLMGEQVSPQHREQGLAILKRSADGTPMSKFTGANLSWLARIQIMRGLLLESPEVVSEAFNAMWSEIKIEPIGREGIQADYSFHQHGPLIYNGGYGGAFMTDAVLFHSFARDTGFALPAEKVRILIDFMLNGQDWVARRGFDPSVDGREITRKKSGVNYGLRSLAATLAEQSDPRQAELQAMAKRLEVGGVQLSGHRHFWRSDFTVHQREGYYASVRTHSTRTLSTDGSMSGVPINLEGRKSHHVADGVTYIMRRGDEYHDIFPVWNWGRLPGVTAEQRPIFDEKRVTRMGNTAFVGGVSDGTYGASAIDFARDGLSAKKAWFFFQNEFVALGAGITNTSENTVLTSVNQTLLNGEVRTSNGTAALPLGERAMPSTRWVLHDGIGYVFPPKTPLHVANQNQSGRWSEIGTGSNELISKEVFSLWIEHGVRPNRASYEYIVVPNTDTKALAARVERPATETLRNTPELQAVRHNGLKIVQAVFYAAGVLPAGAGWTLRVDQPCIVMMRETPNGVQLSVANPENKRLGVNLEIDRSLRGEGATTGKNATTIRFDLPDGAEAGSSVVRTFENS